MSRFCPENRIDYAGREIKKRVWKEIESFINSEEKYVRREVKLKREKKVHAEY